MGLSWFMVGYFTCAALYALSEDRWKLSLFYVFVVLVNLLSALEVF